MVSLELEDPTPLEWVWSAKIRPKCYNHCHLDSCYKKGKVRFTIKVNFWPKNAIFDPFPHISLLKNFSFNIQHLKNQQNPSELFFIEYKKKLENYICG